MININLIDTYNIQSTWDLLLNRIQEEGIVSIEDNKEKHYLEYCIIQIEKAIDENSFPHLPYIPSITEEDAKIIEKCFIGNTNSEIYDIGNRIFNNNIFIQFSEKDELKSYVTEHGSVTHYDVVNYEAIINQVENTIDRLKEDPTIDNLVLQVNTIEDCKLNNPTILLEIGIKIIDNKVAMFPNFIKCNFIKEFFQYILGIYFIQDFISKSMNLENGLMMIQCRNLYMYTEDLLALGQ